MSLTAPRAIRKRGEERGDIFLTLGLYRYLNVWIGELADDAFKILIRRRRRKEEEEEKGLGVWWKDGRRGKKSRRLGGAELTVMRRGRVRPEGTGEKKD